MPASQHSGKARRLVLKFEKGLTGCASEATAYGKCVVSNLDNIQKHVCQAEFQTFKGCMQKVMKRKW